MQIEKNHFSAHPVITFNRGGFRIILWKLSIDFNELYTIKIRGCKYYNY